MFISGFSSFLFSAGEFSLFAYSDCSPNPVLVSFVEKNYKYVAMNSNSFLFILFVFSLFIAFSCTRKDVPEPGQPDISANLTNASYGQNVSQNFSLILPAPSHHPLPVIILLHGGSWSGGQKEDLNYFARRFADYGFAAFSVDYRLASATIHGIDMMNDIQTMIKYIDNMSVRLNLDNRRINFFGYSAGAHLAMLYAYAYDPCEKVSSVISLAGPTDILGSSLLFVPGMYNSLSQMVGDTIRDHWVQYNPIHFASSVSPPTLLISGLNDETVPYCQAISLFNALNQFGGIGKTILIENQYHAFSNETFDKYLPEIISFVKEYSVY